MRRSNLARVAMAGAVGVSFASHSSSAQTLETHRIPAAIAMYVSTKITSATINDHSGTVGSTYYSGQANTTYDRIGRMFLAGVRFKM